MIVHTVPVGLTREQLVEWMLNGPYIDLMVYGSVIVVPPPKQ